MSQQTKIEWTDASWNPVRGCTKVSPGCIHCYAERFAERFRGVSGSPFEQGFDVRLVPEHLYDPLGWVKPRKIFVNSMSDLFHTLVPDNFTRLVFEVMAKADWHLFQLLTKRALRMRRTLARLPEELTVRSHIWLGVSVEDRKHGLPRIDELRRIPAGVRFVSIEPLLEDLGAIDLSGIDWIIVGGESGPGARPMKAEWVLSVRDQCAAARVPFFFKQWGGTQKHKAGRRLDGQTYDEWPEIVGRRVPSKDCRALRSHSVRQLSYLHGL